MAKTTKAKPGGHRINIEIPIGPALDPKAYVTRDVHVEVQAREIHQSVALRRLLAGLIESQSMLRSGRIVRSMPDAVKWIAERIDDQLARNGGEPVEKPAKTPTKTAQSDDGDDLS